MTREREFNDRVERLIEAIYALGLVADGWHDGTIAPDVRRSVITERDRLLESLAEIERKVTQ